VPPVITHEREPMTLFTLMDALYDCPSVACGSDDVAKVRGGIRTLIENRPVAVDDVLSVADTMKE
jgi:hypothetical protein